MFHGFDPGLSVLTSLSSHSGSLVPEFLRVVCHFFARALQEIRSFGCAIAFHVSLDSLVGHFVIVWEADFQGSYEATVRFELSL